MTDDEIGALLRIERVARSLTKGLTHNELRPRLFQLDRALENLRRIRLNERKIIVSVRPREPT